MSRYFIAGGAGFIGSNIVDKLLKCTGDIEIVAYDNLSSGKIEFLKRHEDNERLKIVIGDINDYIKLVNAMKGCDVVIHLASNPDIAKSVTDPTLDFFHGTILTQNILEAMRLCGIRKILYASGSGVYGDNPNVAFHENYAPLQPISTYGASKLAGEALICAYCNMFNMIGRCYRFANVVGKNQTHGVAYDFIKKLRANPNFLEIWGDGTQTKSYIHVSDVMAGIFMTDNQCKLRYDVFNVATEDYIDVNFIANMVAAEMGISKPEFVYTGGDRGFNGDVPIIKFNTSKIRDLYGWSNDYTSRQAMQKSIKELLGEK